MFLLREALFLARQVMQKISPLLTDRVFNSPESIFYAVALGGFFASSILRYFGLEFFVDRFAMATYYSLFIGVMIEMHQHQKIDLQNS